MPNLRKNPSAEKRIRQSIKRRARNRIVRGHMRRAIRVFRSETDPVKLNELLPHTVSTIDKAAKKGVIHKNTAARYKSNLVKYMKKQQETTE